jgi:hypothetical protein
MALELTQPLTEMCTCNLSGGNGRPARKADLTAVFEPTVEASTACYRGIFTCTISRYFQWRVFTVILSKYLTASRGVDLPPPAV